MAFAGIAFLIGVLLAQQLQVLPGIGWVATSAGAGLCLLIHPALRFPALILLGFSWTLTCAQSQLDQQLSAGLEGQTISVVGVIAGLPDSKAKRVRFLFDIDTITFADNTLKQNLRVRLSWYGRAAPINVGERWQLAVRLKRPHGFSNPGGFDYEKWLFQKGINATGYVFNKGETTRLQAAGWRYLSGQLRQYLAEKINRIAAHLDHRGTLLALSIGDRSGIDRKDWQRLTDTGTNHLFAISGLHIGLMSLLAYYLAGVCWRLSPLLYKHLSQGSFACGWAIVLASLYAMMAGFALPTQRALIMLLVPAFAVLCRRRVPPLAGIGTALLLVLVFDPMSTLSPGFWLSFAAVGVIIFSMAGRVSPAPWWQKVVGLQIAVSIGLSPLLLAEFGQVPSASGVANLFAVPWVSFIVVPLTLLGVAASLVNETVAAGLFQLADYAVAVFWFALIKIESGGWFPVLSLNASAPVVLFASFGVALLLIPRGSGLRPLSIVLLLPLLSVSERDMSPGDIRVYALDVGQGLSVIVQTQHKTLVYDTGGRFSATFDAGDAVLVPALKALNVAIVDKVIVSHADLDHRGGLPSLLEQRVVREILSSDPKALKLTAKVAASNTCIRGQHWQWDSVDFDVLYPTEHTNFTGTNNRSCVVRITSGDASVLLPGDIEQAAEQVLLPLGSVSADIVFAPHHGSKTSSSPAFVAAVNPLHVVYAVGYRNPFGFPKQLVTQRYHQIGATAWRTDHHGAVVFEWSKKARRWSVYAQRNRNQRFWHNKPNDPAFTTTRE